MNPIPARQLGNRPVAPCLRKGKLLIAASATFALNAAPCFLRVCFMSCSPAIGASSGQGSTLTNCLVSQVHLTRAAEDRASAAQVDVLYRQIGQLKVENDFLSRNPQT